MTKLLDATKIVSPKSMKTRWTWVETNKAHQKKAKGDQMETTPRPGVLLREIDGFFVGR